MNTRILAVLLSLTTPALCLADHDSELTAFRAADPGIACKYELLVPSFPQTEVRGKEEIRDGVLAALGSVARRTTDSKQKAEVERQIKSWKGILDADVETAKELQKLVGPEEKLFIFRFVDGIKVQSGYLTLFGGKIVQRHVLIEGEDFGRGWSESKDREPSRARPATDHTPSSPPQTH